MKFDKKNPIKVANNVSIRKGDTVIVLAGKDKGKKGKVIGVDPIANTCVVDGVNVVVKHQKARSAQQKSARTKKPAPIHISNVQILCKCGKATRVAHKINEKGIKNRVCAKCSEVLDKKFVKTKEKSDDVETKKDGEEEKKDVAKKPLARREVKATADVKIKKPLSTSSKPSAGTTHRKMGGG
jgi:large subunit ribosomal protein L24